MLSSAMAAVGQARSDATAAMERHVERAKEMASGAVGGLSTSTPCAVCGAATKGGDGGACGDVGDMGATGDERKRCYSCLTARHLAMSMPFPYQTYI